MLGFLSKALGAVASAVGIDDVAKTAVETIKRVITGNPELQKELASQELEFKKLSMQEGDSIRQLFGLEVKQESKFVKYARPAMLWLIFGVIGANYILVPIGNLIITVFGGEPMVLIFPELPDSVLTLVGAIFALYTGARSYEKTKNGKV